MNQFSIVVALVSLCIAPVVLSKRVVANGLDQFNQEAPVHVEEPEDAGSELWEHPIIAVHDENASVSVLQVGAEDVECFCIDNYEFVDFDDYGPDGDGGHYEDLDSCAKGGGGATRCNEICEKKPKNIVGYEGKRQTISFCGEDNGLIGDKIECQCMDGAETFKHSNRKKALKKYRNANVLSQFAGGNAVAHTFEDQSSAAGNLKKCYENCPHICKKKDKLTGGCAMPNDA